MIEAAPENARDPALPAAPASTGPGTGELRVAIAGQPNVGKSTLFTRLTGATLETGNWPGKTVERREGTRSAGVHTLRIVDLPGSYSLTATSDEERIARAHVLNDRPDVVAVVLDASALERGLYLLAELLQLRSPIVVALNMVDVARREGRPVDAGRLSEAIGLPVVPIVARSGHGIDELVRELVRTGTHEATFDLAGLEPDGDLLETVRRARELVTPYTPEPFAPGYFAHKLVEGDAEAIDQVRDWLPAGRWRELDVLTADTDANAMGLAGLRYAWAGRAARAATDDGPSSRRSARSWTDRIDAVALHPLLGIVALLGLSWCVYRVTLELAGPVQDLLDGWVSGAGAWLGARVATIAPWAEAFVVDGLFASVGLLVTFLPVLAVFFFAFALLEDSGYMSRAAFILDRFMSLVGLRGRSFMPMFVGAGCNVPAIFGARVIESRSARLLTILLVPLVPCSARLIVLALLVPAFFAAHASSVSIGLIALNVLVIALLGLALSRTLFRGERQSFVMELPRYGVPSLTAIGLSVWTKLKAFLKDAGTMIVVVAMIVWALSTLPGGGIEDSYLGRAGHWLEPLGAPMDMDWRLLVAIFTGFIAKEVVIATLGVLYATGSEESLVATMTSTISPATALAFLVITMLFIPCVGTVAAMRREAGTRWMLFGTGLLLVVSWGFGILIYQLASLAGLAEVVGV